MQQRRRGAGEGNRREQGRFHAAAAATGLTIDLDANDNIEIVAADNTTTFEITASAGGVAAGVYGPTNTDIDNFTGDTLTVQVGAGTFDRYEGRFDLSGPITEDAALMYRVVGLAQNSDTQVDFVDDDRYFIAPSVTWAGEDTTLTLLANYQRTDAGWSIQFLPSSGTVLDNPNGRIPRHTFTGEPAFDKYILNQFSVGYQVEHHFNECSPSARTRTTPSSRTTKTSCTGSALSPTSSSTPTNVSSTVPPTAGIRN